MNNAYNNYSRELINMAAYAAETLRWSAEDLSADELLNEMFGFVEGSHCPNYLALLEAAGRRAAAMLNEM